MPYLKQFFIKWLPLNSSFGVPVYLGGLHKENPNLSLTFDPCQEFINLTDVLHCEHKEDNDRHFYNINRAMREEK